MSRALLSLASMGAIKGQESSTVQTDPEHLTYPWQVNRVTIDGNLAPSQSSFQLRPCRRQIELPEIGGQSVIILNLFNGVINQTFFSGSGETAFIAIY